MAWNRKTKAPRRKPASEPREGFAAYAAALGESDYYVGSPEAYRGRTLHATPEEMEAFLRDL